MADKFQKKGVSSVVSAILIVMISVAAGGAMFLWLSKIQGQGQGNVEGSESALLENVGTCVDIPGITFDLSSDIFRMVIQNCGSNKVEIGDDNDQVMISSTPCTFLLDCDMVTSAVCPMTLLPGAMGRIDLDTDEVKCENIGNKTLTSLFADEAGITHQIIISIDKKATATRSFIPQNSV